MLNSAEFRSLCPASAHCLSKRFPPMKIAGGTAGFGLGNDMRNPGVRCACPGYGWKPFARAIPVTHPTPCALRANLRRSKLVPDKIITVEAGMPERTSALPMARRARGGTLRVNQRIRAHLSLRHIPKSPCGSPLGLELECVARTCLSHPWDSPPRCALRAAFGCQKVPDLLSTGSVHDLSPSQRKKPFRVDSLSLRLRGGGMFVHPWLTLRVRARASPSAVQNGSSTFCRTGPFTDPLRQIAKKPLSGLFAYCGERGFEPSIEFLTLYSLSRERLDHSAISPEFGSGGASRQVVDSGKSTDAKDTADRSVKLRIRQSRRNRLTGSARA